jgi:hypothetical protein
MKKGLKPFYTQNKLVRIQVEMKKTDTQVQTPKKQR